MKRKYNLFVRLIGTGKVVEEVECSTMKEVREHIRDWRQKGPYYEYLCDNGRRENIRWRFV